MSLRRRTLVIIFSIFFTGLVLNAYTSHVTPRHHIKSSETLEEQRWIATSNSWIDRTACSWFGICGLAHYRWDYGAITPNKKSRKQQAKLGNTQTQKASTSGSGQHENSTHNDGEVAYTLGGTEELHPESFATDSRVLPDVPQFVLDHAPLVQLYSKEEFWPSDPAQHLENTTPHLNYTPLTNTPSLSTLGSLNNHAGGRFVYLQSDDNVEERPAWLGSEQNVPEPWAEGEIEEGWAEWVESVDGDVVNEDREAWWEVGEGSAVGLGGHRHVDLVSDPLVPVTGIEGESLTHVSHLPPDVQPPPPHAPSSKSGPRRRRSRSLRHTISSSPAATVKKIATSRSGRSSAPATLILVRKDAHTIDAFWFYFYSYNLGRPVLKMRFGNHVGDWEHSLVRFVDGVPKAMFLSAHSGGKALSWESVEKRGVLTDDGEEKRWVERPVVFAAEGSHALYAKAGDHPYILPGGLLKDTADRGHLWDPTKNFVSYYYDYLADHIAVPSVPTSSQPDGIKLSTSPHSPPPSSPNHSHTLSPLQQSQILTPTSHNPAAPISWFFFAGHWGDKFYELGDSRQWRLAGQYHYVNGPLGPRFKNLGRKWVCGGGERCDIGRGEL